MIDMHYRQFEFQKPWRHQTPNAPTGTAPNCTPKLRAVSKGAKNSAHEWSSPTLTARHVRGNHVPHCLVSKHKSKGYESPPLVINMRLGRLLPPLAQSNSTEVSLQCAAVPWLMALTITQ
ncbi:hypothetical protein Pelo_5275 [Pelomyxa schiedti]|nr:hypothetical protein Pelo_5275 [Pelomyxa schiedti]